MNIQELKDRIKALQRPLTKGTLITTSQRGSYNAKYLATNLLLDYISDPEVTELFNNV